MRGPDERPPTAAEELITAIDAAWKDSDSRRSGRRRAAVAPHATDRGRSAGASPGHVAGPLGTGGVAVEPSGAVAALPDPAHAGSGAVPFDSGVEPLASGAAPLSLADELFGSGVGPVGPADVSLDAADGARVRGGTG
ncbi:hypothetical protein [Longispora urticae]